MLTMVKVTYAFIIILEISSLYRFSYWLLCSTDYELVAFSTLTSNHDGTMNRISALNFESCRKLIIFAINLAFVYLIVSYSSDCQIT